MSATCTGTPCQRTCSNGGEEGAFWAFHDIAEAKLVARCMSELGKSDGIHVTVGKGLYDDLLRHGNVLDTATKNAAGF